MATSDFSFMDQLRSLKNPLPHLKEAQDAMAQLLVARRDLLVLEAEIKTKQQIQRVVLAAAALIALCFALFFLCYWMTMQIYQGGVQPWIIAIICFALFGAITAGLAFAAYRVGQKNKTESSEKFPLEHRDTLTGLQTHEPKETSVSRALNKGDLR